MIIEQLVVPDHSELLSLRQRLVVVPGYCHLRPDATDYSDPSCWFLNKYQERDAVKEIGYVVGMIRSALNELVQDECTVVCFSGGYTSREAGASSSEAGSYLKVAKMMLKREPELYGGLDLNRVVLDTSSYDSNNNLRGAITAFYRKHRCAPDRVAFYAYELKQRRMELVAEALGISRDRFEVKVVHGPIFDDADREREDKIVEDMSRSGDMLLVGDSRHAQLSRERNWNGAPVDLLPVDEIRALFGK